MLATIRVTSEGRRTVQESNESASLHRVNIVTAEAVVMVILFL